MSNCSTTHRKNNFSQITLAKYIDPALAEIVALRIKEFRDQYGHTQEFLIDKVGLSINRYAMLERVP